jgi:hypothetical protein
MNRFVIPRNFAKLFLALTFLAGFGVLARAQSVFIDPNGARIETRVKPQKTRILLGEPIFIEVDYTVRSFENILPRINRDIGTNGISVEVFAEDGTPVARPYHEKYARLAEIESWIPPEYAKRNLFLPRWADFKKPGIYRVKVLNRLETTRPNTNERVTIPIIVETTITILPADDPKLGAVIRDIGRTAPTEMLLGYDDPRTIPFLIERLEFLGQLKPTSFEIVGQAVFPLIDREAEKAKMVRLVRKLAWFNNQAALKGLSEEAKSSEPLVREAVATGLAFDSTPETLSILQKLLEDKEESVQLAARQSLETRTSANPK